MRLGRLFPEVADGDWLAGAFVAEEELEPFVEPDAAADVVDNQGTHTYFS